MKTTVFFSGALRSIPLICLLAGGIFAASPALAAKVDTVKRPVSAKQDARKDAFLAEVAERVREKALFAAKMAPVATRLLRNEGDSPYRRGDPEALIDLLWQMRSAPALQKEWLLKMSAPGLSAGERERITHEFASFIRETERFMRDTPPQRTGNLWTKLRGMFGSALSGENPDDPGVRALTELEKNSPAKKPGRNLSPRLWR